MFSLSAVAAMAQDPNCVGDHHEGCPVLVLTETTRKDPGCKSRQVISHGDSFSLFKGWLAWKDGRAVRPITDPRVFRECLDEDGHVVRSCPMDFTIDPDGSFSQDIWRKSVDETLCKDDVLTIRTYEERVQLRFTAERCDDLIVPFKWPSDPETFFMTCRGRK